MANRSRPVVAFQGEPGAFSHAAALKLVDSAVSILPCPSFKEVFMALDSGAATYSVIPIENTLHGSVHENYDHLLDYSFAISGETSIRISHNLIAMPGVSIQRITEIYSHPVALNQCKVFLENHKKMKAMPFYDTAGSVKHLKEKGLTNAAAIASSTAAEIYEGVILRRNIEDMAQNYTRFFLLTKQSKQLKTGTGDWKTSLVFSTANKPGALFRAMACFALRDLNLTKVESRPLRGKPWEYLFYVDCVGDMKSEVVKRALESLTECSVFVKLLGSYRPTP